MACKLLESRGHRVVAFRPRRVQAAVDLFYGLLAADGAFEGFYNGLQGEKLHSLYTMLSWLSALPWLVRRPLAALLDRVGERRSARLLAVGSDCWRATFAFG